MAKTEYLRISPLSPATIGPSLGNVLPIANQYTSQWLFCDVGRDCFDTVGIERTLAELGAPSVTCISADIDAQL
jgi:hypothetical protein